MKKYNIKYIIARLWNRKPCAIRNSKIEEKAVVGNGSQIVDSEVGNYTYIYGSKVVRAKIGKFCSIAEGCIIGGGQHPTNWVSSSPAFYKGANVLKTNFNDLLFEEYSDTIIGNDVWIASQCLIKGGISIGNGAIIGMGSVVTRDVPPYEIWAGNPAKLIRKRFDDDTIERLSKIAWWDWDDSKLMKYGSLFKDPNKLIEEAEKNK